MGEEWRWGWVIRKYRKEVEPSLILNAAIRTRGVLVTNDGLP